jgi:hypothetical protein
MINSLMRDYKYSLLGGLDEYGQPQEAEANGTIKMSIALTSQRLNENSLYSGAQYNGLTLNKDINEKYIIHYGDERLKVLYTNAQGRYTQVFMARV